MAWRRCRRWPGSARRCVPGRWRLRPVRISGVGASRLLSGGNIPASGLFAVSAAAAQARRRMFPRKHFVVSKSVLRAASPTPLGQPVAPRRLNVLATPPFVSMRKQFRLVPPRGHGSFAVSAAAASASVAETAFSQWPSRLGIDLRDHRVQGGDFAQRTSPTAGPGERRGVDGHPPAEHHRLVVLGKQETVEERSSRRLANSPGDNPPGAASPRA